MHRIWLVFAAISGLIATIIAALAAHLLAGRLDEAGLRMLHDTVTFQGWQTAALLGAGLLARDGRRVSHGAAACLAVGLLLFCTAVYALAFGVRLPSVAPTGGLLIMAGWLLLAVAATRA